jgi:hypothetical protein
MLSLLALLGTKEVQTGKPNLPQCNHPSGDPFIVLLRSRVAGPGAILIWIVFHALQKATPRFNL